MDREDFLKTYGFAPEDLDALLEQKQYRKFREHINRMNEADIAEQLEELPEERLLLVFRMLQKDLASEVFAFLPVDVQETVINAITDAELTSIIEDLYVDDAVDMLEELPASVVGRVLKNVQPNTRNLINQFLNYPENSAGSIMTSEYLALHREMEVHDAFDYIRAHGQDSETIYDLFVTDGARRLEGVVTIKDLLMHAYEDRIGDLMESNLIKCTTTDDQEDVAELFSRYGLMAIPVVDGENRLVGIVTVDDAVEVLTDEATEDMEKMAAIIPTDRPYFKTSVLDTWKSRVPWLMMLMLSATFTSVIINSYETALAAWVALTGFIPMLMDTGGNAGSQSTVTIIRALSLGDVEFSQMLRVIWKELRVGTICGVSLAVINFFKILLIDSMLLGNAQITPMVDLAVCLTLVFTVLFAQLVGCVLPMLADRLNLDPAVMASPLITTIVDAASLLIYFYVASVLLGF